jgi:tRNA pseudouridine38-40 synthase
VKFKLVIAYDGTAYQGWQVQKIGTGVQEKIEAAFGKLFPSVKRMHSSSRTDTGVHALGMVAHVEIPRAEFKMPAARLALALNAWLPDDIRMVVGGARAEGNFTRALTRRGKQYRYFVWNHAAMNPLLQNARGISRASWIWRCARRRNYFVGKRDFKSFAGTRSYEMESTVRG